MALALRSLRDAELTAIASRDRARAEALKEEFGAKIGCDREALLRSPEIDVVYIATPNHRHHEDCLAAIAAGKAVLCEKPLATNAAEAREIAEAAIARGVFCMEGMWTHFIPAVREAERLAATGALGSGLVITASFGTPVAYDEKNRLFDPLQGGGALLDRGCYPISLALKLLGTPESISSECRYATTGVDTTVVAMLRCPEERFAMIEASIEVYMPNAMTISGSAGRLHLHEPITRPQQLTFSRRTLVAENPAQAKLGAFSQRLVKRLKDRPLLAAFGRLLRNRPRFIGYRSNGYVHEVEEVHRCLRAGRTQSEVAPLSLSVATIEVIDRIKAQARASQGAYRE
jgi:predicted dehydrogenase